MTFSLPDFRALPRWSLWLFRDEGAVSGVEGAQTLISAAQDPNREFLHPSGIFQFHDKFAPVAVEFLGR